MLYMLDISSEQRAKLRQYAKDHGIAKKKIKLFVEEWLILLKQSSRLNKKVYELGGKYEVDVEDLGNFMMTEESG